ncbi:hypothetical protein N7510_003368 [Penicillium lagena]|uniref:uncharacterized protein n=1 Tax=Penicillium lagena TaxID=94218 RepID=UPI002540A34A|nr:uncharacterized protein N7510_003368 [Penicillium lagena]KAJ5619384.1 hypothetical protein N7510_003368 [Penicillium lagena]
MGGAPHERFYFGSDATWLIHAAFEIQPILNFHVSDWSPGDSQSTGPEQYTKLNGLSLDQPYAKPLRHLSDVVYTPRNLQVIHHLSAGNALQVQRRATYSGGWTGA